jgi:outer membrane protein OmpA-like peptidoglycan-associated protein
MFHWASAAVVASAALSFPVVPVDAPITSIDGSMVITRARVTLQSDVLFAFDSAALSPDARARIDAAAQTIAAREPRSVVVAGFTDGRGSVAYNVALSQRRAAAVRAVIAGRLPRVSVKAEGRGERSPVASNATARGRSLNRRVEIRFR